MAHVSRKSAGDWPVRWDLLLRYRLIEVIALWEGRLTTNHLMRAFGIGRQQASKDINTYLSDYGPENLVYDRFLKGYRPTPGFRPVFTRGVADEYLQMMHAREDLASSFEALTVRELNTEVLLPPARDLRPEVLQPVLQACRERKRVEIEYASLANPEPEYRVIQPHTVVHTGYRWHVRAWCEKNGDFRDFVLSRIGDQPELVTAATQRAEDDDAWQARVIVRLGPDPRLTSAQQALIARDYGMQSGELRLKTRGALVSYLLQQLRVDTPTNQRSPEAQQVVVLNPEEVRQWSVMPG
ncbi:helix-turn-helix transcriptional regulator [Alloalcanivorax marinus]|uniref:helix-turn-helix transcriptional regulator n=1 Tax=Alloalcanivorax marinus TaxID=1177169 RepID=UPI00195D35C7|nr:WYL domain-containing protein [Alloalcanivorax marinus]MBM7333539.1 WYL domain-containing protein [Alloalcanivorax marinus]